VKITAPGVPDFYQGTELWDFSLVDPDNRRPVDFELRRRLSDELAREIETTADLAGLARDLVKTKHDGRVKMFLIRQALGFRRRHPVLFLRGAYHPVEPVGPLAEHLCAFGRVTADDGILVVVPRLLARRGSDDLPLGSAYWMDTGLPVRPELGTVFRDVFTGHRVSVEPAGAGRVIPAGQALADFPVALLAREA
jgi:(1->4)-alpha-D-glucan 1-alpha-D-glucosylmutase